MEYRIIGKIIRDRGDGTFSQVSIDDFLANFDKENDTFIKPTIEVPPDVEVCEPPDCFRDEEAYNAFLDRNWDNRELCAKAYEAWQKQQSEES